MQFPRLKPLALLFLLRTNLPNLKPPQTPPAPLAQNPTHPSPSQLIHRIQILLIRVKLYGSSLRKSCAPPASQQNPIPHPAQPPLMPPNQLRQPFEARRTKQGPVPVTAMRQPFEARRAKQGPVPVTAHQLIPQLGAKHRCPVGITRHRVTRHVIARREATSQPVRRSTRAKSDPARIPHHSANLDPPMLQTNCASNSVLCWSRHTRRRSGFSQLDPVPLPRTTPWPPVNPWVRHGRASAAPPPQSMGGSKIGAAQISAPAAAPTAARHRDPHPAAPTVHR